MPRSWSRVRATVPISARTSHIVSYFVYDQNRMMMLALISMPAPVTTTPYTLHCQQCESTGEFCSQE